MYKYKGYVVLKDTGVSMPFSFDCEYFGLKEEELLSFIGNKLNEQIKNIKQIQEYKITKK